MKKRLNKYANPSAETVLKVRRIQAMIDRDYGSKPACLEVGLSISSFYQYRKVIFAKVAV